MGGVVPTFRYRACDYYLLASEAVCDLLLKPFVFLDFEHRYVCLAHMDSSL